MESNTTYFCRRLSLFPAKNTRPMYNVGFPVFNTTHSEMSCISEELSKCWYRSKLRRHSRLGYAQLVQGVSKTML